MADAIFIVNLADIERQVARSGPLVYRAMKQGLVQAAEPVRRDAGDLSRSGLSGMNRARKKPPPWSIQKVGQTQHEVYMVPKEKGTRGDPRNPRRRPNFSQLMMGKAYEPALERNRTRVAATVDAVINRAIESI